MIRFRHEAVEHEVACEFIAGCDDFHGICSQSIPDGVLQIYERTYPFGWLGILAEAAPSSDELVYTHHDRGFALFSMRSPTMTRLYLQVPPDEPIDRWSDDAIWDEMLDRYSDICVRRVWKMQRCSWWMTSTLHRFPGDSAFDRQRHIADLDYLLACGDDESGGAVRGTSAGSLIRIGRAVRRFSATIMLTEPPSSKP